MTNLQQLAKEIREFLFEYATINPNYDVIHYTSPDAHELQYCADMLEADRIPSRCWSEWGCGGYKPYSSEKGRTEHDYLVQTINNLIKSN